jgi:predicted amidohydrolase YtcJ
LLSVILLLNACSLMKKRADLIVTNGTVYTVSGISPVVESFAVAGGKIIATGTSEEILRSFSSDSVTDLGGKPVFPGFIDAHCHFYGLALSLQWIDLTGAASFEEVLKKVTEGAKESPGEWIVGRGWDQNLWKGQKFPEKTELDKLFPSRPVVLVRVDGHSLLANQAALDRAGITLQNKYTRDEVTVSGGRLTGLLSENAADRMKAAIPEPTGEELARLLQRAEQLCFATGLTGVTDAGLDTEVIRLMDSLQKQGRLKIHISAMLSPTQENFTTFVEKGRYETDRLHITAIKLYADGSLGSRTALLKRPYADDPGKQGVLVTSPDSIRRYCSLALLHGYQVNTHAIGDSAVRLILEIYKEYLKGRNDLRWRIEHSQVVDPADVHLFGEFSVIPSVQATHATSDMYWAEARLGPERIKGAYAYKTLMGQNGWIPNGTDFPIEKVSPLLTFYAAVSRQDLKGYPEGGFQPENALTREEALKSVTIWAARSDFEEQESGSIEPGKWADFVVLGSDILKIPIREVPSVNVLRTYIHGEKVWSKPG